MAQAKLSTAYPGIRYREHPKRKHGIKADRYYFIRYKLKGKDKEEGVGWTSSGMTAEKANKILAEIRENIRTGKGAYSLGEIRENNEIIRQEQQSATSAATRKAILYGIFFETEYFPAAKFKKKEGSLVAEEALHRKWIAPVLASVPLVDISFSHLEKICRSIKEMKRSDSTLKYALAVISQVWSYARDKNLVEGDSPTKKIKKPRLDNARVRFLTEPEANILLNELALHSLDLRDMTTLSLFCGLRASEIFRLRWSDVNMDTETIFLRHTKSGHSRHAYITKEVREVLEGRRDEDLGRDALIFPSRNGDQRTRISNVFDKTVHALGFNDGIIDNRQKVVFHSLRHTFASWLVQRNVPLYTVQILMGHSEFRMVQRYAHLGNENGKEAAKMLQNIFHNIKEGVQ